MDNKDFKSYFDDIMPILFPGGKDSVGIAVRNIRNSFSKDIDFDTCCLIYVSFKCKLYGYKLQSADVQTNVDYFVGYVQENLYGKYTYSECFELIQCMADNDYMILAWIGSYGLCSFEEDEILDESGDDFGYSIDNPIKTAGIAYSNRYLDHLYKANMGRITYKRIGSKDNKNLGFAKSLIRLNHLMKHDDEPGYKCVDIYEIFDENGNHLTELYVCPYYRSTTKKAPRGFKYTG